MFILNPDPFLLPDYKISPFSTCDIKKNYELPTDNSIDDYFKERFPDRHFVYTYNGRSALNIALNHYNLTKQDIVTILTTSGNRYISSCVTTEIEKFCDWNREVVSESKVILVIHEFGFPYPDVKSLKKYGIPIIEDSAYAFFSQDLQHAINSIGDFVIFSFPKMFPLQIGGLLLHSEENLINRIELKNEEKIYIKKVLSFNVLKREEIIQQRLANYQLLKESFWKHGFGERFVCEPGIVPGVFMFKDYEERLKLEQLKVHYYAHGVQCSIFYGERCFFLPVHQELSPLDIEYFESIIDAFIK